MNQNIKIEDTIIKSITNTMMEIISNDKKTEEIIKKLNDLEVFKTNDEWIRDNIGKIKNQGLYDNNLSDEVRKAIQKFDNHINPFMNKNLLLSDFRKLNVYMDFETDEKDNIIKFTVPSLNIKMLFQRKVEYKNDLNHSLTFYMQFKDDFDNIIEITHVSFYWGNAFWIKDGDKNYFFGSELYKNDEQLKLLMEYLEMATTILEEDFIPLIAYDYEDYQKRTLKNNK